MDVTITNMRKRSMQSCDGRHSAAIAKAPDPKTKLAEVRAKDATEKACGGQGRKSGGTSRQIVRKNPIESSAIWGSVVAGEAGGTSGWTHGLGYLCSAFRREGLIPDELSLQLSTFLRSLRPVFGIEGSDCPPAKSHNQSATAWRQAVHRWSRVFAFSFRCTQHPRDNRASEVTRLSSLG